MEQAPILNRYKPLFTRGRGGFANVQVAWDTRLQRRVAIKDIPLKNYGEKAAGIEEARTAALLNNPNIVSIYDFETTPLQALIIMENVDGPTLTELMAASSELLDIDTVTAILDGIVQALEFAHENQVLHLDVKPDNVLIDHSGHIKVSDFGLAELAGEAGFGEPQGGTIGYMPPEQLEGEQVDARTDLWALASLAYLLLTGSNPFFALSAAASLAHIVDEPLALPSALREDLDTGVDEALIKALDADITERQPSVAAFWAQLHPYLGRVSPGRRRLKALVQAWASREQDGMIRTGDGSNNVPAFIAGPTASAMDPATSAGTGVADYTATGEPAYYDDDTDKDYQNSTGKERRESRKNREPRAPRQPRIPFWTRASQPVKTLLSRLFAALGSGSMTWLGLSGVAYLSEPVAAAATAVATSTASPIFAESEFSLIIRIALTAAIAVVGFLAPSVGSALALLALCAGIFFTGNWLVGMIVLAICIAWWLVIGRQNVADATVLCLAPLLGALMIPALLPLLAGYFENWKRALGTALTASILVCMLMITTVYPTGGFLAFLLTDANSAGYGQLAEGIGFDFLHCSLNLMRPPTGTALWLPLATMLANWQFWTIVISWVAAAGLMAVLCSRKSRVYWAIGCILASLVLATGNVLVPILLTSGHSLLYITIVVMGLSAALILALLLVIGAVTPQPFTNHKTARSNK